jgi:hypothetical protein
MFKKQIIFFLISLLFSSSGIAQTNLVPNPSFEYTVQCPINDGNITDCANWMNFGATPDYYHACGSFGLNMPNAGAGYQYARTGMGMAGLISWCHPVSCSAGPNYREYVGAVLTNTLQIGTKYFMSFFINWSGYLYGWRQYASNKIGLRFSTVASNTTNPAPINNFAHLKTNIIYQDTVNWLKISGSFIADSVYKYILIGNFFNDTNTDTLSYPGPIFGSMAAYYYIDDVCVSTDSLYNLNWTGIKNYVNVNDFSYYPNPAIEKIYFNIPHNNLKYQIILYNSIGKNIRETELKEQKYIDVSDLENGIYLLKIYYSDVIETKKIIISKP